MDALIKSLHEKIQGRAPELLALYTVMANEARFGRALIDNDLRELPKGAKILEVGGGIMLLSAQLAAEGFDIVAVEPTGDGFGEFEKLRELILELASVKPRMVACGIEDFVSEERFDYAFSVNVMEHVGDPEQAIRCVSAVLKPAAAYRFLCPNYLFPYEPHFNIPLIFNKRITERFFRNRIYGHAMQDAAGVWKSLNWITVPRVRAWAGHDAELKLSFHTGTLAWMFERVVKDPEFAKRRSRWMVKAIGLLVSLRLHQIARIIPAILHPIMDVRLEKR